MLIYFLRDNLRENGFSKCEAPADADTLIAKVTVEEARDESDLVVHADDNVFCLLMHHWKDVLGEVFFQTFKKNNESRQTWRVKDVNENVDECILDKILSLHAWSGCDTTSWTYGMGKIQSGNRCEGVIGCKQTLLPLSRNAIFLGRSELFFKQKCCFLSNSAPFFQRSNPLWNFTVCAWVVLSFFFCVFCKDFLWNGF